MINTQREMLMYQWQVFKDAAAKWRRGEEGMTTVEVVIIAAVLLGIATALAAAFTGIWNKHSASITG